MFGLVVISIGGEMVATGAQQLIAALGVPAFFMGMIVTPAAIELEEVARQAIPSKHGRTEKRDSCQKGSISLSPKRR
jgi:Ca2+/Na+ antiporter